MSDYETIQARRNIIVGFFVLIALCAFVWLIYKFGDLPTKVSRLGSFRVFIQFPIARGIQRDTPVRFCGYPIGKVTAIEPPKILKDLKTGQFYHQTLVVINIDDEYDNIPSNIDIKLMTRGLGSSYIELVVDPSLVMIARDPNRPETVFLVNDMWMQGSTGMTSEFFPAESQKKLDELADGLKSFMANANNILGDEQNRANIKQTLANMTEASAQATTAMEEFKKLSVAGVGMSEELSETIIELRLILEKINNGEGTAAKLVNDGRLYENLIENTQQIQVLLEEMKLFVVKSSKKGVPIKLK
ncbi:MAG: MCE family protein [Planctomycetes bacterium]|nr:MCE family protein [Planctomycetota bacterium]